ncbi:MAG: hypothetical protein KIT11_04425 [Fimbriimonadaceae bacterium]|nr:hypothetical protein [Fimbriimonadaceae bacterium]QYK56859.1 MAG: hypothetical protein KF733_05100 [Fimbriimonadaceae bacterium]
MSRTTWIIIALAVGALAGAVAGAKPWQEARKQRDLQRQAAEETRAAEKDRTDLAREAAAVDGPLGRERLARERGYRHKDETPVESVK